MTDAQIEIRIAACARHLEAAHKAGDCVTARNWLHVMELTIKQRSPARWRGWRTAISRSRVSGRGVRRLFQAFARL